MANEESDEGKKAKAVGAFFIHSYPRPSGH
jgi:hypothetical protein